MENVNQNDCNWRGMSWNDLKIRLADDPEYMANIEMARRVINNYEVVVNYYIGPMSSKIVKKINKVMGDDSYSDFYLFLSQPIIDSDNGPRPEWHRVSLYDAKDCKLQTYTSIIACRHFYKLANKEKDRKNKEEELLDYKDYESLLLCDQTEEDGENESLIRMRKAFGQLSERDRLILQYLVINKMSAIEVFPMVEYLIHPISKDGLTSDEVKANWTVKQRQDAISLMKGRALDHLLIKYKEQKNYND